MTLACLPDTATPEDYQQRVNWLDIPSANDRDVAAACDAVWALLDRISPEHPLQEAPRAMFLFTTAVTAMMTANVHLREGPQRLWLQHLPVFYTDAGFRAAILEHLPDEHPAQELYGPGGWFNQLAVSDQRAYAQPFMNLLDKLPVPRDLPSVEQLDTELR